METYESPPAESPTHILIDGVKVPLNGIKITSEHPAGCRCISGPYMEHERWMLRNVIADMRGAKGVWIYERAGGMTVFRERIKISE